MLVVVTDGLAFFRIGNRPACQRDQRHIAMPRGDGLRRVIDMNDVGRPAGLGAVHMTHIVEAHVFDHVDRAQPRCVAGAEICVNIVL